MLKHYFTIAIRHLKTNKFYSFLNIGGLSIGIAFTLLVGAFIWSQLQVNKSLKNIDRQYILLSHWKNPNLGFELTSAGQLAKELKLRYPGLVENYYRFDGIDITVGVGDKNFKEAVQIGDSTLLSMYGFELQDGRPDEALDHPFQAVISPTLARKLFGKVDVVGKPIRMSNMAGDQHDFVISGVLKKLKKNSVISLIDKSPGEIFVSTDNLKYFGRNMAWNNMSIPSFIQLKKGVKAKDLEGPMKELLLKNTSADISGNVTPYLSPLRDYYLDANGGVVRKTVSTLSFVALFILFMSIVNFINLSVTRASTRMREIGVRKVLGGYKRQMILQFLTETTLVVMLATGIAIVVYVLSRNLFSLIIGTEIPVLGAFPVYFWAFPIVLAILIGFVAGIYPAFILSGLNVVDALKSKFKSGKDKAGLRKSLVAFQFTIAGVVLICAMIITQQTSLFFSKDLGYNKDFIVSAQVARDWSPKGVSRMEYIRSEFAKLPGVSEVSLSYEIPNGNSGGTVALFNMGADSSQAVSSLILLTDRHYFSVFQMPLLAGNTFSSNPGDSTSVILNNAAAVALGYGSPKEAIGQSVRLARDPRIYRITGVTNDFHFGSMRTKVTPIIISRVDLQNVYRYLSFKIKSSNITTTIDDLRKEWTRLMPDTPFEYQFMEDALKGLYDTEIRLKRAAYTATGLALAIALISVIGIIALNIQRRTKEIGLRKVLGASPMSIIGLFLKDFVKIILVAGAMAIPMAIFVMHQWLDGYAYKVTMTWCPFVLTVFILLACTSLLIVIQTWKAAETNPIESLKIE